MSFSVLPCFSRKLGEPCRLDGASAGRLTCVHLACTRGAHLFDHSTPACVCHGRSQACCGADLGLLDLLQFQSKLPGLLLYAVTLGGYSGDALLQHGSISTLLSQAENAPYNLNFTLDPFDGHRVRLCSLHHHPQYRVSKISTINSARQILLGFSGHAAVERNLHQIQ